MSILLKWLNFTHDASICNSIVKPPLFDQVLDVARCDYARFSWSMFDGIDGSSLFAYYTMNMFAILVPYTFVFFFLVPFIFIIHANLWYHSPWYRSLWASIVAGQMYQKTQEYQDAVAKVKTKIESDVTNAPRCDPDFHCLTNTGKVCMCMAACHVVLFLTTAFLFWDK